MAMKVQLLRLVPLLLLLLPPPLHNYLLTDEGAVGGMGQLHVYHPIIMFPGISCPNLDARLTDAYTPSLPRCGAFNGKGWFPLWNNTQDVLDHDYLPCLQEQMSLVYDPVLNDFRNQPGVKTRVPDFGSSYGFTSKDELGSLNMFCMLKLHEALETVGYRDRDTLFGAPYDLRHTPLSPAQRSQVYTDYFAGVKDLVHHAIARRMETSPSSSSGTALVARRSLTSSIRLPLHGGKKFIKHIVLIAPTPPTGFWEVLRNLASGPSVIRVPTVSWLGLRPMWRTFATSLTSFPSHRVFGHQPLVVTKHRNYSAYDYADFLTALGINTDIIKRVLRMKLNIAAPMVPTTYLSGVGIQMVDRAVYWDSNFYVESEYVYGDGDLVINKVSLEAFMKEISRQQQLSNIHFKFVKIVNVTHSTIVFKERPLRIVMDEILEANSRRDIM